MHALCVMDQSPVPKGTSAAEAIADTVALAEEAEALGYRRFWLAEHHNTTSLAGTAPEVLAAHIAGRTAMIRVGSGGVLLSHYSALKVAETFRVLESLFPGRVDLGVGRADGADAAAVAALHDGAAAPSDAEYEQRFADLLGFLGPGGGPVRAMPDPATAPEVWVLGSSSVGAGLAGRLGQRFCFAHFVSPGFGPQVAGEYRRSFRPSPACPEPRVMVAVSVVCADDRAGAEELAASGDLWHLRPEGLERGPLLPPEEAAEEAAALGDLERERLAQYRPKRIVGDPDQVRVALEQLAAAFGADEVMVRTVLHDPAARRRAYRLLAESFGLAPRRSGGATRPGAGGG